MQTVGLDISKDTIDTAILEKGTYKTAQFSNTQTGVKSMVQWFRECNIITPHICMEATGTYYELAADYLSDTHKISVVNPLKIKKNRRPNQMMIIKKNLFSSMRKGLNVQVLL